MPRRVRPINLIYRQKIPVVSTLGEAQPFHRLLPDSHRLTLVRPMLEPCWRHFSLLGASWAHLVPLAAFVVALGRFWCVLERPGLDFGGSREGPGRVLEPPNVYFARFFGTREHAMRENSGCAKTTLFPRFLLGFNILHMLRERRKTDKK